MLTFHRLPRDPVVFEIIRLNLINSRVLKATFTQFAREDVGLLRDDFAQ